MRMPFYFQKHFKHKIHLKDTEYSVMEIGKMFEKEKKFVFRKDDIMKFGKGSVVVHHLTTDPKGCGFEASWINQMW